ncbi:MAG: hypothetical protein U5Q44_14185 [Dehalococcoidia bacterium]|nr:hypothetical protein [Dehalococcoidia bacterium]
MATNDQLQKYYDALIETYDVLSEAATKANERGSKMSSHFVEDIRKGQREALELGKKLSSDGTNSGQLYASLVEATTAAQGRALSFAQYTYEQSLEAGTESRQHIEKLVEANRQATQAAADLARSWTTENPMTEMFRRTMDAMSPKSAAKAKTGSGQAS